MYIFKSDINKNEYDHFVENHPSCNLLQSYNWANIKNNWKPIYTGVYENEQLVAAGLVLIRPLPLSFSMFYLPRGPILDFKNKELYSIKTIKKGPTRDSGWLDNNTDGKCNRARCFIYI